MSIVVVLRHRKNKKEEEEDEIEFDGLEEAARRIFI